MAPPSNASSLMLLLNNAKYNAGMQASAQATKALNSGVGALSKTLGTRLTATIGALALRRVASGLRAMATDSIKAASDAREMGNQFNVVFSGVAASADRAFRKTADALGIADSTAKTLLGDTGNLLVGFRFTEKEALKLSQRAVKLAGDLTSLTNVQGGTARATKLLVSGMLGHSRALKTLKISVNLAEAATKKKINTLMVERNLTHAQARALFVLNEAYRQSPKAINDLKNTWNAFANTMRRITEGLKEVKEIFGEMILKFSGITPLVATLSGWLKKLTDWWKSLDERARKIVAAFALVSAAVVILVGTFAGLTVILPFLVAGWAIALKLVAVIGALAAVTAVWLVALNAVLKKLTGRGVVDFWRAQIDWAMRAGKFMLGFFINFQTNWKILTEWVKDTWGVLWKDATNLFKVVLENMLSNARVVSLRMIAVWAVVGKGIIRLWADSIKLIIKALETLVTNIKVVGEKIHAQFEVLTKHIARLWKENTTKSILLAFVKMFQKLSNLGIVAAKVIAAGFTKALAGGMTKLIQGKLSDRIGAALGVEKEENPLTSYIEDAKKALKAGGKLRLFDKLDLPKRREKLLRDLMAALKSGGKLKLFEGFESLIKKFPGFFTFFGKITWDNKKDENPDPAKDLAKVLTQSTAQRLTTSAREGTVGAANLTAQNRQRERQISILEKIADNTSSTNDKLDKAGLTPANLGT